MKELITYKEAKKITLAETSEGLHFKGQFLTKENYFIFGESVKVIEKVFKHVYLVEFNQKKYFISEELFKVK